MGKMKALCDTNIVIDLLSGIEKAKHEVILYEELFLSRISWMEVLVGAPNSQMEKLWIRWMRNFKIVELDASVTAEAIRVRKAHRLKLPDAIIWASARKNDSLLITRNTKEFPKTDPGIRFPYSLL
jgi:predicted nucleic acid-binding protein